MNDNSEANVNKTKQVKVGIFGKIYTIKSDTDSAYIEKVADYVDQKMKTLSASSEVVDSSKIAVLAALNIADELFKTKNEFINKMKFQEQKTADLLNRLEQEFKNLGDD